MQPLVNQFIKEGTESKVFSSSISRYTYILKIIDLVIKPIQLMQLSLRVIALCLSP